MDLLLSIADDESVCAEATVESPAREPKTIETESNKLIIFFILKNLSACVPIMLFNIIVSAQAKDNIIL